MKWKEDKDDNSTKARKTPFLVLPKIEVLCKDKPPSVIEMPAKNPNLRLFTKTWPKHHQNLQHHHHNSQQKEIENARPLTATLEKPQILDINLVTKIDMSLIRKEFLCIANLCRVPLDTLTPLSSSNTRARRTNKALNNNYNGVISSGTGNQSRRSRPSPTNRPLSLSSSRAQLKKSNRPCTSEDSWEDERSSSSQTCSSSLSSKKSPKMHKIKSPKSNPVISPIKQQRTTANDNDANNNNHHNRLNNVNNGFKTFRIPNKKRTVRISVIDKTSETKTSVNKLPQPCKTCGRVDQPERLHSHPETPSSVAPNKVNEKITVIKNTVQKPVAIKYKSKLNEKRRTGSSPVKNKAAGVTAKSPEMITRVAKVPVNVNSQVGQKRVASSKGPRTLTCYICGREFGTMSLPLHEPKCMEKWDRENANLPAHLQRKRPVKPDHALTKEEWNTYAWESSQANLVPCHNCGRTFYPDRLVVHQRSCKPKEQQPSPIPNTMVYRRRHPFFSKYSRHFHVSLLPGFILLGGAMTVPGVIIFYWLYVQNKKEAKEEASNEALLSRKRLQELSEKRQDRNESDL